jgi:MarR family 2-MHQ and catechol resistance regulon transcriptional repressor
VVDCYIENPGATTPQMVALIDLAVLGKSRLKDMAERTGSSSQSLCIMYNNLEKEGYILRETDPNDRRNTFYSISENGMAFLMDYVEKTKVVVLKTFEKLSDKEAEELGNSLKKANEIIEKLF